MSITSLIVYNLKIDPFFVIEGQFSISGFYGICMDLLL